MADLFRGREDFEPTIDAAADRLRLPAAIVEKDYWVSQVLRGLSIEFPQDFVFKGGTSLSKVFGVIERFSEDIDALILPGERGRGACDTLMKSMGDQAARAVQDAAPTRSGEKGIHRTYYLSYDRKRKVDWLRPQIELEMGVRGGPNPFELSVCRPLLSDALLSGGAPTDAYEDLTPIQLRVLHPGRTTIEKLALVSGEASKCREDPTHAFPARHGRHLYDIHMLLGDARVREFLEDREQFLTVVEDCERVSREHFGSEFVRPAGGYAVGDAFKSEPAVDNQLRLAFEGAQDLYLGTGPYPTWDEVLDRVRESEALL